MMVSIKSGPIELDLIIKPTESIYLPPTEIMGWIRFYAAESGLLEDTMVRLCWEESRFNPRANSGLSKGLFQLNKKYLAWFSKKFNDGIPIDPFDPETSIRVGCRYFRSLLDMYGTYRRAAIAYNAGGERLGSPPKESIRYARAITSGALP